MNSFNLTIRTPEKQFFKGKAYYIKLFTEQGILKILPKHASLIGTIDFSPVIFEDDKGTIEILVVRRGILMITNKTNTVDLMVQECQLKKELSPVTATEYLKFIEEQLAKGTDMSEFKIKFYHEEKYMLEKQVKFLERENKLS